MKIIIYCSRTHRILFDGDLNWEQIRGMEMAEREFEDPESGYSMIVGTFHDFFIETPGKSRLPLSGIWTATEYDPAYYNHVIDFERPAFKPLAVPFRYRWGNYQFNSLDFIQGFALFCRLLRINTSKYLVNPIEDLYHAKTITLTI